MIDDEEEYQYSSLEVIEDKYILRATCFRCGGVWHPKIGNIEPKRCAKCNSPYWNRPRLRIGDVGAPNKYGFDQWELNKWYLLPHFINDKGDSDLARNETRWRSLAQFARRKGYVTRFDGNTGKMYAMLMLDPTIKKQE